MSLQSFQSLSQKKKKSSIALLSFFWFLFKLEIEDLQNTGE